MRRDDLLDRLANVEAYLEGVQGIAAACGQPSKVIVLQVHVETVKAAVKRISEDRAV